MSGREKDEVVEVVDGSIGMPFRLTTKRIEPEDGGAREREQTMPQAVKGVKGFVAIDPAIRFQEFFKRTDGCWMWTGTTLGEMRYGSFWDGGKTVLAHRFSFGLYYGEIPPGMCVLHYCDVPACVNPAHLFLGTNADNTRDMMEKGRNKVGKALAKLTEDDVREIRRLSAAGVSKSELGRRYGAHRTTIASVVRRLTWRHVL